MTRGPYTVAIQLATPPQSEGCAVVIIGPLGTSGIVADGLEIGTAVKLASRVRARLDEGNDVEAVRLALENGEVVA